MTVEGFLLRSLNGMRRDRAIQTVNSKLKGRTLLLRRKSGKSGTTRFSQDAPSVQPPTARTARRRKQKSRAPPVAEYADLVRQQQLWQSHVAAAFAELHPVTYQAGMALLAELDRHGAGVEVVQSTSSSHIGISGIVLAETSRTVCVMSPDGKTRRVLKQGSTLKIGLPTSCPARVRAALGDSVLLDGAAPIRHGAAPNVRRPS
jgi:RNase P/RNase MRP subunit p29